MKSRHTRRSLSYVQIRRIAVQTSRSLQQLGAGVPTADLFDLWRYHMQTDMSIARMLTQKKGGE